MKNELFVTAREVAQELGVSKPFVYKLVLRMNEELEEKGFITIVRRVSRKFLRVERLGYEYTETMLKLYFEDEEEY